MSHQPSSSPPPSARRGASGAIDALTTLTRRNPSAKRHELVHGDIARRITLGEWPPGHTVPGETELAELYGVSVGTVRRAMQDLSAEGLVVRRKRAGTTVAERSPFITFRNFFHYFRLHRDNGSLLHADSAILDLGYREATSNEAEVLRLRPGTEVMEFYRVRTVEGRRIMHAHSVMPAALLPDRLTAETFPKTLTTYLLDRAGVRIGSIREEVRATGLTAEDRAKLDIGDADAVLQIDEISLRTDGSPVYLVRHRCLTDGFFYLNEVR